MYFEERSKNMFLKFNVNIYIHKCQILICLLTIFMFVNILKLLTQILIEKDRVA